MVVNFKRTDVDTMKQLKPIIADLTALETTPPKQGVINWQLEYNKLREQVLSLKRRIIALESPPRTPEELEQNMLAIRNFANSMGLAEGAVTCANLYNQRFFVQEQDSKFVQTLCAYLVERYKMQAALIEATFTLWQSLAR